MLNLLKFDCNTFRHYSKETNYSRTLLGRARLAQNYKRIIMDQNIKVCVVKAHIFVAETILDKSQLPEL